MSPNYCYDENKKNIGNVIYNTIITYVVNKFDSSSNIKYIYLYIKISVIFFFR